MKQRHAAAVVQRNLAKAWRVAHQAEVLLLMARLAQHHLHHIGPPEQSTGTVHMHMRKHDPAKGAASPAISEAQVDWETSELQTETCLVVADKKRRQRIRLPANLPYTTQFDPLMRHAAIRRATKSPLDHVMHPSELHKHAA